MEYSEYKQISDTLVILQNIECSDFVRDYTKTCDRFITNNDDDIKVYLMSCELCCFKLSIDEFNNLLFKCQYYLRSPEEWDTLHETFANVSE